MYWTLFVCFSSHSAMRFPPKGLVRNLLMQSSASTAQASEFPKLFSIVQPPEIVKLVLDFPPLFFTPAVGYGLLHSLPCSFQLQQLKNEISKTTFSTL